MMSELFWTGSTYFLIDSKIKSSQCKPCELTWRGEPVFYCPLCLEPTEMEFEKKVEKVPESKKWWRLMPWLLLTALNTQASFIKPPSRAVKMVDAISLHISATALSPDIGMVKLYLQSVLDTRSQAQPFKTTAEVLLHGLRRTDRLSDVIEILAEPRKQDARTLIDSLEKGHVGLVLKRLDEELVERGCLRCTGAANIRPSEEQLRRTLYGYQDWDGRENHDRKD